MNEFETTVSKFKAASPTRFTQNLILLLDAEAKYRKNIALLCDMLRAACEKYCQIEQLGAFPEHEQEKSLDILDDIAQIVEKHVGRMRDILNDFQSQLCKTGCRRMKVIPAEGHGEQVHIEYIEEDELVRFELPGIAPFKLPNGTDYQYGKVSYFMSEFLFDMLRSKGIRITIPYALVIFIHHYIDGKKSRNLRDYDNLEKSCVLNALQTTGLFADSPAHMILMELAVEDDRNFTEVRIAPVAKLPNIMAGLDLGMYGMEGIKQSTSESWDGGTNGEETTIR